MLTEEDRLVAAELVRVLDERSEHHREPQLVLLLDRIRRRRRARAATVVVAVVVCAAAAGVTTALAAGSPGTDPAQQPFVPPEYRAGYQLAATAELAVPAQAVYSYTFTASRTGFEVTTWCDTTPRQRIRVDIVIRGEPKGGSESDCLPGGHFADLTNDPYLLRPPGADDGRTVTPGEQVTFQVRIGLATPGPDGAMEVGAVAGGGSAILMVYEVAAWETYPFGPPPRDFRAPEPDDIGPRGSGDPPLAVIAPPAAGPFAGRFERTVSLAPTLTFQTALTGPGRIALEIGGVTVFRQSCHGWKSDRPEADPCTSWSGNLVELMTERGLTPPPAGQPLAVTVVAEEFTAPAWLVVLRGSER